MASLSLWGDVGGVAFALGWLWQHHFGVMVASLLDDVGSVTLG